MHDEHDRAAANQTIASRLFERAREQPDRAAYYVKRDGAWQATEWQDYTAAVQRVGRSLIALGLEPGARVAIVSENRPAWTTVYLAAMAAGCVPVGVGVATDTDMDAGADTDTGMGTDMIRLLRRAEPALVFVDDAAVDDNAGALGAAARSIPGVRHVVTWDQLWREPEPKQQAKQQAELQAELERRTAAPKPGDLAALVYTPGTTGAPRCIMLSHENLACATRSLIHALDLGARDWMLSYLPLCHLVEQLFAIHIAITAGMLVYHAESLASLAGDLRSIEPSVFLGLPHVWQRMHQSVAERLAHTIGWPRTLLDWARGVAARKQAAARAQRPPGLGTRAAYPIAHRLVLRKLQAALGLRHARVCLCVTGALEPRTDDFFASLDIPIYQLYGQAETSYATCVQRPGARHDAGTVGDALPGVELRILQSPDPMIAVRGPQVFLGYFGDPEATLAAFLPGDDPGDDIGPWLRTGDLGHIDEHGALTVVGRASEVLDIAGTTVPCEPIERALTAHPLIDTAMLMADGARPAVLLVLDPDVRHVFSSQPGVDVDAHAADPELVATIRGILEQVSREHLGGVGVGIGIERFAILERPFTVARGELTQVLGLARALIRERHGHRLERWSSANLQD